MQKLKEQKKANPDVAGSYNWLCNWPVWSLPALIVKGGVGDECGHVDVPNPVEQQAEVLGSEAVQGPGRDHVKQSCKEGKIGLYGLFICMTDLRVH